MEPTLLSPRSFAHASGASVDRKSRLFAPLSPHGMPKAPSRRNGPHRFSNAPPPINLIPNSPPLTPMSTSMMSPPLSARSFDTFIESDPSTPTYSPRTGSDWDGSTIVLLSPASIAPSEPEWEMMVPLRKPKRSSPSITKPTPLPLVKNISSDTSLSSHPVTPLYYNKENWEPKDVPDEVVVEEKTKEEETSSVAAPLGKIATRFKSMLKRKTTVSDKKSQRRRQQYVELERMETVHWTEM